jgi:hypothetical protein
MHQVAASVKTDPLHLSETEPKMANIFILKYRISM